MSRVSLIEQLYAPKKKSALEFNYDALWAPPIRFFLSQQDINELYRIATSLKYNDNIEKKYELIDAVMRPRGFKRGNCGTNRVVYNFLEDTSFCMKIALDRVGIKDSPREYKNQEFFKPFCCKIFEVDPTGVIACVERVNPISSLEEFLSISDDVFNMMVTKIIGKYVVDDLGTEKYLNYGLRYNSNGVSFGPVILDYPYAYELDGAKLRCAKPIQIGNKEFACGGEIDYDAGLNNLVCCKCGRTYSARELAKDDSSVLKFYSNDEQCRMRARIVRETDGTILKDSGRSSKIYMTKEEYEEGTKLFNVKDFDPRPVEKTIKKKYTPMKQLREQFYTELQTKAYEEMQKRNAEPFNTVGKTEFSPRPAKRAEKKASYGEIKPVCPEVKIESNTKPAVRAEEIEIITEEPKTTIKDVDEMIVVEHEVVIESEIEVKTNDATATEVNNVEDDIGEIITDVSSKTDSEPIDNNEIKEDKKSEWGEYVSNLMAKAQHGLIKSDEDDDSEVFSEKMEADVFPEIANKEIIIGSELDSETDYSDYNPDDEEDARTITYSEDDDEYSDYHKHYKTDRNKAKKNYKKQQRGKLKYNPDDMSDY